MVTKSKQTSQDLDTFVHKVSHDLRSPLNAIEGYSTILLEEYKNNLPGEAQEFLTRIKVNVHEISEMVDELLDLSGVKRVVNEKKEKIKINEIVETVKDELKSLLEEKNIRLEIKKNLSTVYTVKTALSQIFYNLINNAIKFSDTKNGESIIWTGYQGGAKKFYQFYVQDNGIGFTEKEQARIFDIFYQISVDQTDVKIRIVGLTLVKKIIETLGGKIWLESEKGKGTTFYFTLPKT